MTQQGIFIAGLHKPIDCASWACPFYEIGGRDGPDYCKLQVCQGARAFETTLELAACPIAEFKIHQPDQ